MKAGIALEGAAGHEDFTSMIERTGQCKAAKFQFRCNITARKLYRRRRGAGFEIVDKLVFPLQPVHLPGAKTDQDKQRRQRKEGWPEKRTKFHLHSHLGAPFYRAANKKRGPAKRAPSPII